MSITKSFLQRLFESRMRPVETKIRDTLDRLSDHDLADIGFNPDHVREIRSTGKLPTNLRG
jgi:uncharacterized protein YjiS (DUF1127 family)